MYDGSAQLHGRIQEGPAQMVYLLHHRLSTGKTWRSFRRTVWNNGGAGSHRRILKSRQRLTSGIGTAAKYNAACCEVGSEAKSHWKSHSEHPEGHYFEFIVRPTVRHLLYLLGARVAHESPRDPRQMFDMLTLVSEGFWNSGATLGCLQPLGRLRGRQAMPVTWSEAELVSRAVLPPPCQGQARAY